MKTKHHYQLPVWPDNHTRRLEALRGQIGAAVFIQKFGFFGPPFLLNTTALYQKIRNIQLRILPDDQLLVSVVT